MDTARLRRIDLAMTEFGIVMEPSPGNTAPLAEKIEQLGFDILLSPDTQNLSPDPIGQLNLAGANTKTHVRAPQPFVCGWGAGRARRTFFL